MEELFIRLKEEVANPIDHWQVTAILESMGVTDEVAAKKYGYSDVFALGSALFNEYQRVKSPQEVEEQLEEEESAANDLWVFIRSYFRGSLYLLPIAISSILIITTGFSLWAASNMGGEIATALYLATMLGLIISGGLGQVVASQAFTYTSYQLPGMVKEMVMVTSRMGLQAIVLVAALMALGNWFFYWFPWSIFQVFLIYFVLMGSLWLLASVQLLLGLRWGYSLAIALGSLFVVFFHLVLRVDLLFSQIFGLTVAIFISLLMLYLKTKIKITGPEEVLRKPRRAALYLRVIPRVAYGSAYFTFLFIDRISGWTVYNINQPVWFWYHGEYELAMNVAILLIFVANGYLEYYLTVFFRLANRKGLVQDLSAMDTLKISIREFYRSKLVKFIMILGVGSLVTTIIFYWSLQGIDWSKGYFNYGVVTTVYWMALLAYNFFLLALFHFSVPVALGRVKEGAMILFQGCGINLIVGYTLARWFDYHWAIIGLAAGSIFLYIQAKKLSNQVIEELPYYLYSNF